MATGIKKAAGVFSGSVVDTESNVFESFNNDSIESRVNFKDSYSPYKFNTDGSIAYKRFRNSDYISQHVVTTPFDLDTVQSSIIDSRTGLYDTPDLPLNFLNFGITQSPIFSSDGTKLYIIYRNAMYQFELNNPYDLTSTVGDVESKFGGPEFTNKVFDPTDQTSSNEVRSISFNDDGTILYVLSTERAIYQYALSTAYDISTAEYNNVFFNFSSTQSESPIDLEFNNDGTKMYISDFTETIFQYSLSTPFDITTAIFETSLTNTDQEFGSFTFSADGSKLYWVNSDNNGVVYQFNLSTPFDVSTASLESTVVENSQSTYEQFGSGFEYVSKINISDDGKRLITINNGDDVSSFILDTPFDITTAKIVENYNAQEIDYSTRNAGLVSNNGSQLYLYNQDYKIIFQYEMPSPFLLNKADFYLSGLTEQEKFDVNAFLTPDGTKLFTMSNIYDSSSPTNYYTYIHEYELSTPFDMATLELINEELLSTSTVGDAGAFIFSNDGSLLFVGDDDYGSNETVIHKFNLSTPFDISTLSFNSRSVDMSVAPTYIYGIDQLFVSDDGFTFFIRRGGELYTVPAPDAYDVTSITLESIPDYVNVPDQGNVDGISFADSGSIILSLDNDSQEEHKGLRLHDLPLPYVVNSEVNMLPIIKSFYDGNGYTTQSELRDFFVSEDGTQFIILWDKNEGDNSITHTVTRYELRDPFNITRVSPSDFQDEIRDLPITRGSGITFANDGQDMYFVGETSSNVPRLYNYKLYPGYNLNNSESYGYQVVSLENYSSSYSALESVALNDDGTTFFIGARQEGVLEFRTSEPYSITQIDENNAGAIIPIVTFDNNTTQLYNIEFYNQGNNVILNTKAYDLKVPYTFSGISTDIGGITDGDLRYHSLVFSPDGKVLTVLSKNPASTSLWRIWQYDLSVPFDLTTRDLDTSSPADDGGEIIVHFQYSNDGTVLFVLHQNGNIGQHLLSVPYRGADISYNNPDYLFNISSSVSYDFDINASRSGAFSISPDGKTLAIVFPDGTYTGDLYQYTMSTPFDLSTASTSGTITFSDWGDIPNDMSFTPDGSGLIFLEPNRINLHMLSEPNDTTGISNVPTASINYSDIGSLTSFHITEDGSNVFFSADEVISEFQAVANDVLEDVIYTAPSDSVAKVILNSYSDNTFDVLINGTNRARGNSIVYDGSVHSISNGGAYLGSNESSERVSDTLDFFFLGTDENLSIRSNNASPVYYEARIIEDKS